MFGPFSLAFKALSWKARIGAGLGALLLLVAALGGAFFSGKTIGYNNGYNKSKVVLADYKANKEHLELQIANKQVEIQTNVVTKFKDRVQVIKVNEVKYVEAATNDVPTQYNLSNAWVRLHDNSALGLPLASTRDTDGTPSPFTDTAVLKVVAANYSQCHVDQARLTSLQDYNQNMADFIDSLDPKSLKIKKSK